MTRERERERGKEGEKERDLGVGEELDEANGAGHLPCTSPSSLTCLVK